MTTTSDATGGQGPVGFADWPQTYTDAWQLGYTTARTDVAQITTANLHAAIKDHHTRHGHSLDDAYRAGYRRALHDEADTRTRASINC